MVSKFDLLREGKSVEFKPGVSGRLNKDTKNLELSTGQVLNVSNDRDFFPSDERQLDVSRRKENVEKSIKGFGGEFAHQLSTQGVIGGIRDIGSYISNAGEDYINQKQAEREVSERISQESPWTSAGATGASLATDIGLTGGMSAAKAAPLLSTISSGSRILTNPAEVAGEAAIGAVAGHGLDKVGGYLDRVSKRRGAIRSLPAEQEAVANRNLLGQQAVNETNALQKQQFNLSKQNVKNTNEARLQQYQADLNARQNKMIQAQSLRDQAQVARDAEIIKLKNQDAIAKAQRSENVSKLDSDYKSRLSMWDKEVKRLDDEFKLAQSHYQQELKRLPELQKKAQAEYSQNVVKNAAEIEKSFPKSSRISTEELGVQSFIDEGINKTGIGGSRDASQASRVLKSIFPEGELLGGRELSKRYKALEDAIQRSTPEVQTVLNNFKQHLGEQLPSILENSVAFSKISPLLKKTLSNDVTSIINDIGFAGKGSDVVKSQITKTALSNANLFLKNELNSANFVQKVQSGEMARDLANKILTVEDFLVDFTPENIKSLKKSGNLTHIYADSQQKHAYFVNELAKKLESKLAKYEIKAMESARNASKKLGKDVKGTYGFAGPVEPPLPPSSPQPVAQPSAPLDLPPIAPIQLPNPVPPAQTPPIPPRPSLMPSPTIPIDQSFIPQPAPSLAPAQGFSERSGDLLEKNILGGNELGKNPIMQGVGSIGKLAGLKYALGSAALPVEGAYLAAKGLTSPTVGGEVARMTFKQGGIQAIEAWAQKYPSYHDGILENPQERRSLTKEIEDAYDIPIEQKAILQSKVNRGKPLGQQL